MSETLAWAQTLITGGAAIIAGLAVLATFKIHRETGAQIVVEMNMAGYRPFAGTHGLVTITDGTFRMESTPRPQIELCQVIILNSGRVGATITGVSLALEGLGIQGRAVVPRSFLLEGMGSHDTSKNKLFRLDSYDHATILFDFWSMIDETFRKHPNLGELNVYAEATVAGRKDVFTSKVHGYWRIQRHCISAVGTMCKRRPMDIVATELARTLGELRYTDNLDMAVMQAELELGPCYEPNELSDHLKSFVQGPFGATFPQSATVSVEQAARSASRKIEQLRTAVAPRPMPPKDC